MIGDILLAIAIFYLAITIFLVSPMADQLDEAYAEIRRLQDEIERLRAIEG